MTAFWLALGGFVVTLAFTMISQKIERHPTYAVRRYTMPCIWVASTGSAVTISTIFYILLVGLS